MHNYSVIQTPPPLKLPYVTLESMKLTPLKFKLLIPESNSLELAPENRPGPQKEM